MKNCLNALLLLTLLSCVPTLATSNDILVDATHWPAVGRARLSVLFFDVYDSTLKTPSGVFSGYQEPIALEIHYLRDITAKALVKQTAKEWDALGLPAETYKSFLRPLEDLWPDVQKKDALTFIVLPDGSNTFYYNGQTLGGLDHPKFGQYFLNIWLSPNASRPELRAQLLGADSCEISAC
jgi:hypothetical protein